LDPVPYEQGNQIVKRFGGSKLSNGLMSVFDLVAPFLGKAIAEPHLLCTDIAWDEPHRRARTCP
jgi:hypothetical protein